MYGYYLCALISYIHIAIDMLQIHKTCSPVSDSVCDKDRTIRTLFKRLFHPDFFLPNALWCVFKTLHHSASHLDFITPIDVIQLIQPRLLLVSYQSSINVSRIIWYDNLSSMKWVWPYSVYQLLSNEWILLLFCHYFAISGTHSDIKHPAFFF